MHDEKSIAIIGAGLVGSLLSIFLARRGYKIKIYERRADMRKKQVDAGRSINLALSDRGLLALEEVGLAQEIKAISIPMHGRYIHHIDGSTAFQPYGKEGQYINSVSRATLNMKLMDISEEHGVEMFFNHRCSSIDWKKNEIKFDLTSDSSNLEPQTSNFKLLLAADGAFSAARLQHQIQHDKFDYQQYYIDCGYK
ncbi:MAG TPA: NAD(P)/FAD-dependent oxidoreductase, partial [Parafilimonas sp.]|nr:NAD(P)/FAD-dependent oxidoreductase [Parafilimonas sp.]